jgi:hypothetical protein
MRLKKEMLVSLKYKTKKFLVFDIVMELVGAEGALFAEYRFL